MQLDRAEGDIKMKKSNADMDKLLKELKNIKNLMMLSALKAGATSDEVNYATGMGAANIRAMFPVKRGRKKQGQ